jgi:hypothetical protein
MNLYCFDFFGVPVGYVDENGALFDRDGIKWAQLRGREVYDLAGHYRGRLGAQGSFVAADGSCSWYVRDWDWASVPESGHRIPQGVPVSADLSDSEGRCRSRCG